MTLHLHQSFENQIRLAEELKRYLHGLQERLTYAIQSYQQKCNDLYEAGLMDEFYRTFAEEYVQASIEQIRNVVHQINDCDIPFVERHIAKLVHDSQTKNMVYQGYSGTPVYRIDGNMIYKGYSGTPVYRIEGNMIYEGYSNTPVYRIE